MDTLLKDYLDIKKPHSFTGVAGLARQSHQNANVVRNWLSGQDSYTLHKNVKRRFKRRLTFSNGIADLLQIDLADMQMLARHNSGYRYLLIAIDVFSRKVYALPLKNKTGKNVSIAFATILEQVTPNLVQSDAGTEFTCREFQELMRKHNIKHYSTMNVDIKASLAERVIRTLKSKLYRYFTNTQSLRYIDVLDDLIDSYNNSYHRVIKMSPNEVTLENEAKLKSVLYGQPKPPLKYKYNVDDMVRIRSIKNVFTRGYITSWTDEIFTVHTRRPTNPPTYTIKDYNNECIKGSFYAEELQKITKPETWKIDKVLKTRKRGKKTEYYVSWVGYGPTFNSWVTNLINING